MTDSNPDGRYVAALRSTARAARANAAEARRRGLHGLADVLTDAAQAAESWATVIEDEAPETA